MIRAAFLSAGVPDNPERGPYMDSSDPMAIRDAVRALTAVVLKADWELVFGGHPAITPLVLQAAESIERVEAVVIYQSREFEDRIPPAAREIPNFRWTDRGKNEAESLEKMRRQMLEAHNFGLGIFIGGMDGIEKEFAMFHSIQRRRFKEEKRAPAPAFPIPTTGGAALRLRTSIEFPAEIARELDTSRRYQSLFRRLLHVVEH